MVHLAPLFQVRGQTDRLNPYPVSIFFLHRIHEVLDRDHGLCSTDARRGRFRHGKAAIRMPVRKPLIGQNTRRATKFPTKSPLSLLANFLVYQLNDEKIVKLVTVQIFFRT